MSKTRDYIKKSFGRTDFSGLSVFGRGQNFDWKVLLAFFLLVMVAAIPFSVHVFLGVRAGDIFKDNFVAPIHDETIDRAVLDRVIGSFAARAENLKNLQSQKPVFVDPSL